MTISPLQPHEIEFIREIRVARLATIGASGTPSLVPICFALVGTEPPAIVSVLDEKPKRAPDEDLARVRNINRDSRVSVIVDRYDEDWSKLAFVQIKGQARIIQPGESIHTDAIMALREKYLQYRSMAIEHRAVILIDDLRTNSWGLR